ncbi:MAG: hypothetical protein JSW03_08295 [Candidatus Eiseniibacteriota bacterium]|nr:MAG: hypothetical protein JSW03_08295 [Candidatus Eisenbacteria bacterium]
MKGTSFVLCLIALLAAAGLASPAHGNESHDEVATRVASLENPTVKSDLPPANTQRWYTSLLTQQQIISERIEDMRNKLHRDLLGTQDFLDEVSALFERADRLYDQWKKVETPTATRSTGEKKSEFAEAPAPPEREDVAVGKSLNYLRLSLINFFLGYCDSNGKQIDDAEKQARLSKLWRTRSQLFVNALDS